MPTAMSPGKPAVFLDRDGTIIELKDYLRRLDEIVLLPGVEEGLKLLRESGYLLIMVTNQSGVARGYFDEDFVKSAHRYIQSLLSKGGISIDAFYYCPHHPDYGGGTYRQDCSCRKPKTGMIMAAQADFGIDLRKSWVIGDNSPDMQMAENSGICSVLVKTGYGRGLLLDYPTGVSKPRIVTEDFYDAAKQIVAASGGGDRT